MHFIISNTKKSVSSFVFELCTCLPRNSVMYCTCDCVCVCISVKTAKDRVKGFSSGCF